MSRGPDVIVIGAGLNGMAAAGLLSRRGKKVLVLERRDVAGGLAASEEFHPGYRSSGILHDTTGLRPAAVDALELVRHGLKLRESAPDLLALGGEEGLLIPDDPSRARDEIGTLSPGDGVRFAAYRERIDLYIPVLRSFLEEHPADLIGNDMAGMWDLFKRGLRVRNLGRRDMMELLRLPPMPVADFLDEWFETDLLKGALALPAVTGAFTGPRSPGTTTNLLLHQALAGAGPEGGAFRIARALQASLKESGVDLRPGCGVARILLEKGRAVGVALDDGEEIPAKVVVSSLDPRRTFLSMLPMGAVSYRLRHRVESYRMRGCIAHVLLAIDRPVRFASRVSEPIEFARTCGSLDEIEQAYDAVKYGRFAERPVLDIHVPTVSAPELAPEGHSVVSILVHGVPHALREGWSDAAREALGDRVVDILDRHVPGIGRTIVGQKMRTPADIETELGLGGGHLLHGEPALDQILIRPAPECAGYRTPVPGLFLCGGSTHPGGGLTCGPALLAAKAILSAG